MSRSLYILGLVSTLGLATLTWMISVLKRDVSIVDGVWALMLLTAATVLRHRCGTLYGTDGPHPDAGCAVGRAPVKSYHPSQLE
ncbi:hypothetical protein EMGBD2_11190 [Nitrospirota bacterium]|nr:hypothetical protein EMGBD2_11190 [Nitrospirota bacterium]